MAGNRAEVPRATVASSCRYAAAGFQFSTLQSAKSNVTDSKPSAPTMNQLEVPAQNPCDHRTAAQSTTNMPAPSSLTHAIDENRHDSIEVDHEDDKQCRQQDNGHEAGNQRGINDSSDDVCELTVNYDGFGLVSKPFAMPCFNDGDEDVVNVRSPIMCKPLTVKARSASLSPTCVSALARDEVVKSDAEFDEPSWTIQEFQEYLGMLELLQDVSSDAKGGEMCLSADCLGQMERLLTSLLPQGV